MRHRHKFKAIPTTANGIRFDSKKEARRYEELLWLKKTGEVIFFLRQPQFDLPGGVKYRADFQVFWANGTVSFEDVKGMQTKSFIRKKKQVESLYPVEIEVI